MLTENNEQFAGIKDHWSRSYLRGAAFIYQNSRIFTCELSWECL